MASINFIDGRVEINSVNLSAFTKSVSLDYSAESLDETAMGDTTRKNKGGLLAWSGSIEMKQDFGASAPDVSLFSLVGTTVSIKLRPTTSSIGPTNPEYQGTALIESYAPLGNGVGDLATASVKFVSAGALTRATS